MQQLLPCSSHILLFTISSSLPVTHKPPFSCLRKNVVKLRHRYTVIYNNMDFNYTDSQGSIAAMIRDFANKNIRPDFMEWDETQKFPVDLFHKMGELGLMGVLVPTEYGGSGLGYFEYVTVFSEIAKGGGS